MGDACAGKSADSLRHAFYDAFTTFAVLADTLLTGSNATATLEAPLDNGDLEASMTRPLSKGSSNHRTLILLANCGQVRSSVMAELGTKYAPLHTGMLVSISIYSIPFHKIKINTWNLHDASGQL